MRAKILKHRLVVVSLAALIICCVWRFRQPLLHEGLNTRDCLEQEFNDGPTNKNYKYVSQLRYYGEDNLEKMKTCKNKLIASLYSENPDGEDNEYETCEDYHKDNYIKNVNEMQRICGTQLLQEKNQQIRLGQKDDQKDESKDDSKET